MITVAGDYAPRMIGVNASASHTRTWLIAPEHGSRARSAASAAPNCRAAPRPAGPAGVMRARRTASSRVKASGDCGSVWRKKFAISSNWRIASSRVRRGFGPAAAATGRRRAAAGIAAAAAAASSSSAGASLGRGAADPGLQVDDRLQRLGDAAGGRRAAAEAGRHRGIHRRPGGQRHPRLLPGSAQRRDAGARLVLQDVEIGNSGIDAGLPALGIGDRRGLLGALPGEQVAIRPVGRAGTADSDGSTPSACRRHPRRTGRRSGRRDPRARPRCRGRGSRGPNTGCTAR